jgi:formate-dependent phosphoribosylglycinamide formyltransferase (GAR transformylase)
MRNQEMINARRTLKSALEYATSKGRAKSLESCVQRWVKDDKEISELFETGELNTPDFSINLNKK